MSAEVSAPQWRSLGFNGSTSDGCGPPPQSHAAAAVSSSSALSNGGGTAPVVAATTLPDLIPVGGGGGGVGSPASSAKPEHTDGSGEKHINHNNNIINVASSGPLLTGAGSSYRWGHPKKDDSFNCELVFGTTLDDIGQEDEREDGSGESGGGGDREGMIGIGMVTESNTDRDSGFETPSLDTTTISWEKPEVDGCVTSVKHRTENAENDRQGQHYVAHVVAGECSESKDTKLILRRRNVTSTSPGGGCTSGSEQPAKPSDATRTCDMMTSNPASIVKKEASELQSSEPADKPSTMVIVKQELIESGTIPPPRPVGHPPKRSGYKDDPLPLPLEPKEHRKSNRRRQFTDRIIDTLCLPEIFFNARVRPKPKPKLSSKVSKLPGVTGGPGTGVKKRAIPALTVKRPPKSSSQLSPGQLRSSSAMSNGGLEMSSSGRSSSAASQIGGGGVTLERSPSVPCTTSTSTASSTTVPR
uniref:Uncharacterized protein n=1 Tax=Anopheles maculatus TaxID=74869 RepID=A0A182T8N1_9DIPT